MGWFLLAALLGCRSEVPGLRRDIRSYLGVLRSWSPAEAEAARAIDRILATHFVDEAEVRHQVTELQPRVARHLDQIRAYQPATPGVMELHHRYVAAWEGLADACRTLARALDGGRVEDLARAREGLERWVSGIQQVAQDLRRLADELSVDPAEAGQVGPAA